MKKLILSSLIAVALNALFIPFAFATEPRESEVCDIAGIIDNHISTSCKEHKIRPAELCTDAIFLRRVYLDLTGHIPPMTVVRDFLDDPSANKRATLVHRLLTTDEFSSFSATVWHKAFIPTTGNAQDRNTIEAAAAMQRWLVKNIKNNTPYDKMVRQVIEGVSEPGQPLADEFAIAADNKPETLAAWTARQFLGIKLDCAQCHKHPFASYSREQFWQQAAFFATLGPTRSERPMITIPDTTTRVEARFLDGSEPQWKEGDNPRRLLADWIVRPDNPDFGRTAVNRLWARFMGIGLVDPVDDFGPHNPPSHPKLLEELAKQFSKSGFDQRLLIEGILNSTTYQRDSVQADGSQADLRQFGRRAIHGLMPEQIFDSLVIVSDGGVLVAPSDRDEARQTADARSDFLQRFSESARPTESSTSLLQTLYSMNGPLVTAATRPVTNPVLRTLNKKVAEKPDRCIEELYLLALSRRPSAEERKRMAGHVNTGRSTADKEKALADILWVLLNSAEFNLYQ